jgi:hypothetical protein
MLTGKRAALAVLEILNGCVDRRVFGPSLVEEFVNAQIALTGVNPLPRVARKSIQILFNCGHDWFSSDSFRLYLAVTGSVKTRR